MDILCALLVLVIAFCLDYFFGDRLRRLRFPLWFVRCLVKKAECVGSWLITKNKGQEDNSLDQKLIGVFCMVVLAVVVGVLWSLLTLIPCIGYILLVYFIYLGLNTGALVRPHREVFREVENAGRGEAQYALARIVDEETVNLDKDAMRNALAKRLAARIPSDVVAPLFWFTVGFMHSVTCGLVLLWIYKVVCIAHELWAPKFGAACAKYVLEYIPSWIAVFLLWLVNFFTQSHYNQGGTWPGFVNIAKQAKNVQDANAGRSMAAVAWLMRAGLCGKAANAQAPQEEVCLGAKECNPWTPKKILALEKLVRITACANVALLCALWLIF